MSGTIVTRRLRGIEVDSALVEGMMRSSCPWMVASGVWIRCSSDRAVWGWNPYRVDVDRQVMLGDPASRPGTSQAGGDEGARAGREAPIGRSGDGDHARNLAGEGGVGEHGDGTHGCADQDDSRVWLLSPGRHSGDVMTFEVAERRHAGGLTVASSVVGEDVEFVGLEALGESDKSR
jgi:hypothetical protein